MGASVPHFVRTPGGSWYCPDDPGEPLIEKPRVSITEEEGKILAGLAADRHVLEIGTGLGVSTRALARFAMCVYTHDIDPWVWRHIWPTLPENILTYEERPDTTDLLLADLVFIDANHATEAVTEDLAYARRFNPSLIVLHDAKYDNVARAMLADSGDWTTLETEHGLGLGR